MIPSVNNGENGSERGSRRERRRDEIDRNDKGALVARVLALQDEVKAELSRNPKLSSYISRSSLDVDPSKLSSADLKALLNAMAEADKKADAEESSGVVGAIGKVLCGIASCAKGLLVRRNHNEEIVNMALKDLGNLQPLTTEINQMAMLMDKNNTKQTTMIG